MKHVWLYSDLLPALMGKRSRLSVLNRGTLISASALLQLHGFFWGTYPAFFVFVFVFLFQFLYKLKQYYSDDYNCKPEQR